MEKTFLPKEAKFKTPNNSNVAILLLMEKTFLLLFCFPFFIRGYGRNPSFNGKDISTCQ